ncbi:MAG: nucleotidyltransferase domain-containing protein [Aestuariivita sp.]|nr:nucleotidyltransferase domain-containing protein [Aestuariivita sp.]
MSLITSRQHLTTLCEQAVHAWPQVKTILLFGSRARNTARPDSDWDIAVVADNPTIDHVIRYKHTPPPAPFEGYTNLDVLTLTPVIIAQDRCAFGRIAQQIAQDGQPLIGDWSMNHPPSAPAALILPKDWRLEITMSLNHMTIAFNNIDAYKQSNCYDDAEAYCRSFVESSQMAAEYLVKTMLKRRKVLLAQIHNIERLAAQMRAQRPDEVTERDWTSLASRMAALNGHSHRDHQAGYGDYRLTAEDITRSATRLSTTFLLLVDEVESALHPQAVLTTMGLSAECLGNGQHQSALAKAGRAIHATIQSLQSHATRMMALADTPKTADDPPDPAVASFLAHCQPVKQLISPHMIERVVALTSTDGRE